ncbi:bifunctional metallophosphatase/5'-nucleotidase [Leptolyngbya sp. 'hensonii']|uniref:bifunctional metallophosphatase/5'-nucleotidase n=1 Tax=Leptolyngbya sp. 'hensonii' TaxID=1922337 RepID=UPI00094F7182|nr:bifunctional metallophosphatase/5'-nucleotidase [Leptolyngbya sp. 'hensonii']OLP20049.1 bifunctional metallophosphatase/5'-nucleotidase [Leptolyngbya sp. 'hensonii']
MVNQVQRWGLGWGILLSLGFAAPTWAEIVPINLLHLNDVYEITPVQGGKRGGLARVATIRKQLLQENPRTYTLLAGDLFSPSALGTAKVKGERLAGRQIVAVMNTLGLDYATFGNHEFDLSEAQFLQRLQESTFRWFSSNVTDARGAPFPGVLPQVILTVKGERGDRVRLGLIGLTLPANQTDYVRYQDVLASARKQVKTLRGKVDILIAVTHLAIEADRQLAAELPDIDLILGGHEHENIQQWRVVNRLQTTKGCPRRMTPIFKADANAVTVYIHRLTYDTVRRCLAIQSTLQAVTADIPEDSRTAALVKDWLEQGFQGFRADGFEPTEVVATTSEALDGLESTVRNQETQLTRLIARSLLRSVPQAELAIFNSGAIRVDDVLPPGPITQYDVIRILPFGGKVLTVNLRGDILQQVLDMGQANRGSGGYLQTANVSRSPQGEGWLIQGQRLDPQRAYRVAINDFLVSGREQNLGFLKLGEPGIEALATGEDIRFALMRELRSGQQIQP